MPSPLPVLNIAAYQFLALGELAVLEDALKQVLAPAGIKGTVLLAHEGINLFLAAPAEPLRAFLGWLRQDPRFAQLQAKESWSRSQPFRKLLVKIKPEIIRMDHPAIQPSSGRAPALSPAVLKRWLDAGHDDNARPVVLLDTRNRYETACGTFKDAIDWQLDKFTQFPAAAQAHLADLAGKTVVSFCTGGIRCEKAAIFMREQGLENVYQLDGGILRYFEEQGAAHYEGGCFVFDERRVVDPDLAPQPAWADGYPLAAKAGESPAR
jgi:UPF0176 protein